LQPTACAPRGKPGRLSGIVLNVLPLAADSLPEGGQIMLAGTPEDLFIRLDGPRPPTGMAICLANEAEARSALTDEGTRKWR
jgi:hypothetical protein